jgi:hypothetical protein
MTVSFDLDKIVLTGKCGAADADDLLALLVANPSAQVDISAAEAIHTGLWQIFFAYRVNLIGSTTLPFVERMILPALGASSAAGKTPSLPGLP